MTGNPKTPTARFALDPFSEKLGREFDFLLTQWAGPGGQRLKTGRKDRADDDSQTISRKRHEQRLFALGTRDFATHWLGWVRHLREAAGTSIFDLSGTHHRCEFRDCLIRVLGLSGLDPTKSNGHPRLLKSLTVRPRNATVLTVCFLRWKSNRAPNFQITSDSATARHEATIRSDKFISGWVPSLSATSADSFHVESV